MKTVRSGLRQLGFAHDAQVAARCVLEAEKERTSGKARDVGIVLKTEDRSLFSALFRSFSLFSR